MLTRRITLSCAGLVLIASCDVRSASAQRNVFREVIREGANQILNNAQGGNNQIQPGGGPPRATRSAIPGESGRGSGGSDFERDNGGGGWVPVPPPSGGTRPPIIQPQPYQPPSQPYQPQPYQPQPYQRPSQPYQPPTYQPQPYQEPISAYPPSRTYPEPPILNEPGNGLPLKITVPKAQSGQVSYTLIGNQRNYSMSLKSGFTQNLKATQSWNVRYTGSSGTKTYRIRGGNRYVFQRSSSGGWDLYKKVSDPPTLSAQ